MMNQYSSISDQSNTTTPTNMKTLVVLFALVVVALAHPGGSYGGGGDGGKATEVIHGAPVVTAVFKSAGLGQFTNYAPKIEGPLITRGIGPHVGGGGGGKGHY